MSLHLLATDGADVVAFLGFVTSLVAIIFGRAIVPRIFSSLLDSVLGLGGEARHPPEWLLEAAGTELGTSFRVQERPRMRLDTTRDGWREASIELDSRDPRYRYTATITLQLRGRPIATGEATDRFRLEWTGSLAVWPAGLAVDRRFEEEGRLAIDWLVRHAGARSMRVDGDRVRVELETRPELWGTWVSALRRLESVAKALDPPAPPVEVHADARARGELGSLRCAYCHEDLAPGEPDVARCERCGTVLHAGCRAELGRCPALGCGASERPRTSVAT